MYLSILCIYLYFYNNIWSLSLLLDIHLALEEQKEKYKYPHPKSEYITFFDNNDNFEDPIKQKDAGTSNKPGYKVRKQTRDIASTMKRADIYFKSLNNKIKQTNINNNKNEQTNTYFLFLEDDMRLCEHGYLAMYYMLRKAELYHPNFLALRASFGMNGLFFHASDIGVFASYLLEHQARRPPDHLVVEWFAGEKPQSKEYKGSRPHVAFRYNLFHHLGVQSSLRSVDQTTFPYCYEPLGEPILFQVEAYDPIACPEDDIWPCKPTNSDYINHDFKKEERIPWGFFWDGSGNGGKVWDHKTGQRWKRNSGRKK